MSLDDGQVRKKIRPGSIEVVENECAIVVKYKVEYYEVDVDGREAIVEKKPGSKKIKVNSLNEYSNIPLLAKDVVNKCKLISSSKTALVEQLLYKLRDRESGAANALGGDRRSVARDEDRSILRSTQSYNSQPKSKGASIDELDSYLECMYDSVLDKVNATEKIAQLASNTEDLEALLMHEPLIGALSRVLRDDGRKSIELATNIITVFFTISNFSQFHQVIIQNQIGNDAMKQIDLEIQRTEYLEKQEGGSVGLLASKAAAARMNGSALSEKQDRLLSVIAKQDRFFYITFYLLLNMSENVNIEKKMRKRSIVTYLSSMLTRVNADLLILSVTFLKKLSIYRENKEEIKESGVVDKLTRFVPVKNGALLMQTLRLLHNLSFDESFREEMARNSLIPKLVGLMRDENYQQLVLGILYHMSIEDKNKSMFSYTDALDVVSDMLLGERDSSTMPEMVALAVNLSQNRRNAEILSQGQRLGKLIGKAIANEDELLFKIVRNISQDENPEPKRRFKPFISDLASLLNEPHLTSDFLIEVVGTLGNLALPEFGYDTLIDEHDILGFLEKNLLPNNTDDDMLLEAIIFVGTICSEHTASRLVSSKIIQLLLMVLSGKKDDEEIVLQVAYTLYKLLLHQPTRDELLHKTEVLSWLVEILNDKNKEVRQTADKALDHIMDVNEEYCARIREMKFQSYNQEWIEVATGALGSHSPQQGSFQDGYVYT